MQFLKQAIVDIAPINDVEAARLHQAPPFGPLRSVPSRDRDIDGPLAQDRKGHMHLGCPMLVVLPQGPGHPRQGRQEAAIDGGQLGQRSLLGQRQVRAQVGPQRGQHLVQQRRVKDVGRFTEGTQGRLVDPEALLHFRQRRRLLQAAQAGDYRVKKVQQHQAGILMVEQPSVPGAISLRASGPQMRQERFEHAKILETLEGLLCHRGGRGSSHAGLLVYECVHSCTSLWHVRYALYPTQNSCRTLLGPDRNRKVKTQKPRRLRTADSRNCQTLRVPRQSRGFTMIKLHSKLCVLIFLSIYHILSVQCLHSLHGHTLQYHLSTCRICNVSWFPTNRGLQKKCVKKKHKLYTCITMFTESTEFPIRECCTCVSLRWRTRRVGSARPPQRLTLGQA